jgi:integrase
MSLYKRGRVYWFKFVWNGELIRESTKQRSAAVARQIEAARRTALAKGEVGIRERKLPPTLGAFCTDRLEPWAKSTFERTVRKSWDWYRTNIRILCASSLSSLRLDKVTDERVVEFAAKRLAEDYAVASVNSTIRVLRRALRLAVEWEVIDKAPKLRKLSGENRREHVVTRVEEEKYYVACKREPGEKKKDQIEFERYRDFEELIRLLFGTGLRPEEAYELRWEHVTWDAGDRGTLFVAGGKTPAARRSIPLSPDLRAVLEARWGRHGEPIAGWIWPAPTQTGHADVSTFRRCHRNAVRASKVRPFVIYSARHTFLTRLGEGGCDVWTLARIAGHSNISISMRYVHPSQEVVAKAFANVGGHNSGHIDGKRPDGARTEAEEVIANEGLNGEPGRTRTCDPLLRRQMLYPPELRAPGTHFSSDPRLFRPSQQCTMVGDLMPRVALRESTTSFDSLTIFL